MHNSLYDFRKANGIARFTGYPFCKGVFMFKYVKQFIQPYFEDFKHYSIVYKYWYRHYVKSANVNLNHLSVRIDVFLFTLVCHVVAKLHSLHILHIYVMLQDIKYSVMFLFKVHILLVKMILVNMI